MPSKNSRENFLDLSRISPKNLPKNLLRIMMKRWRRLISPKLLRNLTHWTALWMISMRQILLNWTLRSSCWILKKRIWFNSLRNSGASTAWCSSGKYRSALRRANLFSFPFNIWRRGGAWSTDLSQSGKGGSDFGMPSARYFRNPSNPPVMTGGWRLWLWGFVLRQQP